MSEPFVGITVNGAPHPHIDGQTVAALIGEVTGRELAIDGRATDGKSLGVAVVRNNEIVPRSRWSTTTVYAGDTLEILSAVQGG